MSALSLRARLIIVSLLGLFVFSIAFGIWQQAGASPVEPVRDLDAEAQLLALAPGEELVLADGTRLRFTGLVSDSRCPMDAMCPSMGEAIVAFTIEGADGAVTEIEVAYEGGTSVTQVTDAYVLTITDVQPYPMASDPADPADYRVELGFTLR